MTKFVNVMFSRLSIFLSLTAFCISFIVLASVDKNKSPLISTLPNSP